MFRRAWMLCGLLLAACGGSDNTATADANRTQAILSLTADVSAGATSYTSRCASCHGSDGKSGSANRNVASVASQNASEAVSILQTGEDEMPSFSSLSDQELANIVGYLRTLLRSRPPRIGVNRGSACPRAPGFARSSCSPQDRSLAGISTVHLRLQTAKALAEPEQEEVPGLHRGSRFVRVLSRVFLWGSTRANHTWREAHPESWRRCLSRWQVADRWR